MWIVKKQSLVIIVFWQFRNPSNYIRTTTHQKNSLENYVSSLPTYEGVATPPLSPSPSSQPSAMVFNIYSLPVLFIADFD